MKELRKKIEDVSIEDVSLEAKELINGLLEEGYSPKDITFAMEDGAYLKEAGISQELSEEVHSFLTEHQRTS